MTDKSRVSDLTTWIDPRGLKLSDRIWRNRAVVRNQIAQTLRTHLAEGRSTQETAMALQRYVNPDYGGNAYSGAERLVVTETSRAHALATKQAAEDDPAVRLMRRFTSAGHPRQDECDDLANRNVGYGPGIYPIDDCPLPPTHPRCACGVEAYRTNDDMTAYAQRLRVEYGLDAEPTNLSPADLIEWRRQTQELKDQVVFLFRGWTRQTGLVDLDLLAPSRQTVKAWVAEVKQAKTAARAARLERRATSTARAVSKPDGTPVSNAFRNQLPGGKLKPQVQQVLDSIDAVHGDGTLPELPVEFTRNTRRVGGYHYRTGSGQPVKISLSSNASQPAIAMTHEIGHFLDHQAIGVAGRYASATDEAMQAVMQAAKQSEAVQSLEHALMTREIPVVTADGVEATMRAQFDYVRYLLTPEEIWARSYAQYIAMKSGNEVLLRQLTDARTFEPDQAQYGTQWADEDFAPILAAIDDLFRVLGWIT